MMASFYFALFCVISTVIVDTNGYLYCVSDCQFSQSLDSPFIIPDKCNKTKIDSLCQVHIDIDYTQKTIHVRFSSAMFSDRKRSIDDKYDYIQETTTIDNTNIITNFFYSCTLEDQCEENYLLEIQSKLIKADYRNLQKQLMSILTTSQSSSLTCKRGSKEESIACNGTCSGERNQLIDQKTGQPKERYGMPSCYIEKISPNVKISASKLPLNNRSLLSRGVYYYCSENDCNRQDITNSIEKAINENYKAFYQQ